MSDVAIGRKRLAAVEEAYATLRDAWAPTAGVGVLSLFMDRAEVDVADMMDGTDAPAWITVAGCAAGLQRLAKELEGILRHAERVQGETGEGVEWIT